MQFQIISNNQTASQQSSNQNSPGSSQNLKNNYNSNASQGNGYNQGNGNGLIGAQGSSSVQQQSVNYQNNNNSQFNQNFQLVPHPNSFAAQMAREKNNYQFNNNLLNKSGQGQVNQFGYNIHNNLLQTNEQFNYVQHQQQLSQASQNTLHHQQQQQQQQHNNKQQQQQQSKQQFQNQQSHQSGSSSVSSSSSTSSSSNGNQQQFRYKTHKCRHFLSGNCTMGEKCNFAHSDKELRDPQDPLPANVLVGQKIQITNFKTIKCRYYDNGYCKNSEKCSFAHGNLELLTPGVTLNNINAFPQQNQIQLNEMQKEQMRKESIEQQNNLEYIKSNISDVINDLKYAFASNPIVIQKLDETSYFLSLDQIENAHKTLLGIFEDPQRTIQDKQLILSTIKKYNNYYKGIMESKYKQDQMGYNQSNFFQHYSFEGFSLDTQNTYMNGNGQSDDSSPPSSNKLIEQNNQQTQPQHDNLQKSKENYHSLHANHKSNSSTGTSNSNQNGSSNLGGQNSYNSVNNISSFNQYQNGSSTSSNCSSNDNSDCGRKEKSSSSPIMNNLGSINQQVFSNNFLYQDYDQKIFNEDQIQDQQDYQSFNEINQIFKSFNIDPNNQKHKNEGSSELRDSEILEKRKQIQEIFSEENQSDINFNNECIDISNIH